MYVINLSILFIVIILLSPYTNYQALSQRSALFEPPVNVIFNEKLDSYSKNDTAVMNAAKWLESTPLNEHIVRRRRTYKYILDYLEETPKINGNIFNKRVLRLFSRTSELVGVYLANYISWVLDNKYFFNSVDATVAGIRSAMSCYLLGGVAKDRKMMKLIRLESTGGLYSYIRGLIEELHTDIYVGD